MQPDTTLTRAEHRAGLLAADEGLRYEVGDADLLGNYARAVYSTDDRYRYLLTRRWASPGKTCTWIMLNPSTATADTNDPTIGRCVDFARNWGYSAINVVNLFALRSTEPRALYVDPDPVGEHNDRFIRNVCREGDDWLTIAAWGIHGRHAGRAAAVERMLDDAGIQLSCLGLTSHGHPKHPLYLRGDLTPQPYVPAAIS